MAETRGCVDSNNQITTEDHKDFYLIGTPSKINILNAGEIRKTVECAIAIGRNRVVFDLSKTVFVDSAGLEILATAQNQLNEISGKLYITSLSSSLNRLLETSGILKAIEILKDLSELRVALGTGIKCSENGFYVLLTLPARFNIEIVRPLRIALDEAMEKGYIHFVFDFSQNRFITSVGVGILVTLQARLRPKGGGVYLTGLSEDVRNLLQATNLLKMLKEYSSLEEINKELI